MTKMMEEQAPSCATWETLDTCARLHVQACIQPRREDELTELLGRPTSARRGVVDAPAGARNGHGKRRRLALMNGTVTVQQPRVRDVEARVVSWRLPRFQRQTPDVRALLPERYLPGLALRDFEHAFRGLVGDAAPLSPRALLRLKATWQGPCAVWQQGDLRALTPVYARVSLGRRRVRESRA